MKVFVLICGLLFAAAVGYFVIDRLGRFLDRGGISPYWDEEEERLAVCEKKSSFARTPYFIKRVATIPIPR